MIYRVGANATLVLLANYFDTGHRYEIHPQREMPSVDMEFHLREWLVFLRAFVYGRDLEDNDYIFPSVNTKGLTQPGAAISHATIQKWLDEFVAGACIKLGNGRLTTHCLRRGGAQYHFMHAPVGKRWSLATIRWWGGWAEGEHVSFILTKERGLFLMMFDSVTLLSVIY